jgi:hypothetical protein
MNHRSMITRILTALLFLMATGGTTVRAQEPDLCRPTGDAQMAAAEPDIVIRAGAQVEQLRFESQPQVSVRLTGCSELDSVRVTERRNLPDPVEPGVTYRDVAVGVEILGHLDVRCLISDLARPGLAGPADPENAPRTLLRRLCARQPTDTVPR